MAHRARAGRRERGTQRLADPRAEQRPSGRSGPLARVGEGRWAIAAAAVPLLFYWQTTRFGFLLDDYVLFQRSASLSDLTSLGRGFLTDVGALRKGAEAVLGSYYRPLFLALSTLYYQLAGGGTFAWHLAAVLLAAAIGRLAWALLRRVGLSPEHSLLGSLLFSLHPSHVSSVAWASGIQELLATLFVFLALLALVTRPTVQDDRRALILASVAFAAALLSKEVAIGLLPLVGIWAWLRRGVGPGDATADEARRFARAGVLFAGVVGLYLGLRVHALGALANPWPHAPGLAASLPSVPLALLVYLRLLLWPFGFSIFRPERPVWQWHDPAVWWATLVLVGLTALVAVAWRRRRGLVLPVAWFAVWLLPVLNFWTLDPQWMVSDRYLFLPSLALPWLLAELVPARRLSAVLGAAVLVCAAFSWRYTAIFADERTFVAAMERAEPTSPLIYAEKARQQTGAGDLAGAEVALRRAVALDPRSARNLRALGDLELERGDLASAEGHYRVALGEEPKASRTFKHLAMAHARAGSPEEALRVLEESARRWPEDGQVELMRAILLFVRGDRAGAESAYARAVSLRPDDEDLAGGLEAASARMAPLLSAPSARPAATPARR